MKSNRPGIALSIICSITMAALFSVNAHAEMRENVLAKGLSFAWSGVSKYAATAVDIELAPKRAAHILIDKCRIPELFGMVGMNDVCHFDRIRGVSECHTWASDFKDSYTVSAGNEFFSAFARESTAVVVTIAWGVVQLAGATWLFQKYDALKVFGGLGIAFIAIANAPRG